ncbi:MFS transporter [Photobacterium sp. ZSDE20]|uniref:MFS transporter n=1 Tax=Photobacterium pectinilyticum TaxID=2906793 RepID=A0ABT1N8F1_9GAMM|nr:MFS transporter [Photobacterium sp. ZSDE20]MCQ1061040.1 MFS transporter [Photobacterium sp. ZSDE20]MDD1829088.1 MFS transporter [Photobacterium sp. ZSDE20]
MSDTSIVYNQRSKSSLKDIWSYSIGEGATSIAMNGVNNFALLFYTQVLGLNAALAGLALSISVLWDAISDPVMGYVTDNTTSRYGRRHIYMFFGGILLAVSFLALWTVPDSFSGNSTILFGYLLVVNLIMRTSLTVFVVPYTALGFEICKGYESRAKLQSVRSFLNMCVNFVFGALAWSIFFKDSVDASGARIDGTKMPGNFLVMGITLSVFALIMILLCVYLTRAFASTSNDNQSKNAMSIKEFMVSTKSILSDRLAIRIFALLFVGQIGVMLTAQLQVFAYVDFLNLSSGDKTLVHGSTMVGFAIGALAVTKLVNWLEKQSVILFAVAASTLAGIGMYLVFSADIFNLDLANNQTAFTVPSFAFFQGLFWFGWGIVMPLSTSMIADVSAISEAKTGQVKDGGYSAMFSFALKASTSFALLFCGGLLAMNGYVEGVPEQTAEVAKQVATTSFLVGPFFMILATVFLYKYPVNRAVMAKLNDESI